MAGASFAYGRKSATKVEREADFLNYIQSLNEIEIEIEIEMEEYDPYDPRSGTGKHYGKSEIKPITYTKDNKTYLKVKK